MGIAFRRVEPSEADALADLLTVDEWPFHAHRTLDRSVVLAWVAAGHYDSSSARTFWILDGADRVGLIRLFDLDNGTPLFDLRIAGSHRGRGLGGAAVRWLTGYLFEKLPEINRIEATTRADNLAMRRVLSRCGYVQEAHYRQAWPAHGENDHDAVGYATCAATGFPARSRRSNGGRPIEQYLRSETTIRRSLLTAGLRRRRGSLGGDLATHHGVPHPVRDTRASSAAPGRSPRPCPSR